MRSELLVPAAEISVTGAEPTRQAVEALATLPAGEPYARAVQRAVAAVAEAPRISRQLIDATSAALDADRRRAQPQALPPGRCAPAGRGAAARGLAGGDAPHHRAPQRGSRRGRGAALRYVQGGIRAALRDPQRPTPRGARSRLWDPAGRCRRGGRAAESAVGGRPPAAAGADVAGGARADRRRGGAHRPRHRSALQRRPQTLPGAFAMLTSLVRDAEAVGAGTSSSSSRGSPVRPVRACWVASAVATRS